MNFFVALYPKMRASEAHLTFHVRRVAGFGFVSESQSSRGPRLG